MTTILHLHIPKTAGTALREVFKRTLGSDEVLEWDPVNPYQIDESVAELKDQLSRRREVRVISGHFMYGIHSALGSEPYKYITVLRNPLDRILSQYLHNLQTNLLSMTRDHAELLVTEPNVVKYVSYPELSAYYNNLQARYICGLSPVEFDALTAEEITETCAQNIQRDFLFVGSQESLNWDVSRLFDQLNLDTPTVSAENTRGRLMASEVLSETDLQKLSLMNQVDLELVLRYSFGNVEPYEDDPLFTPTDLRAMPVESEEEAVAKLRRQDLILAGAYRNAIKDLMQQFDAMHHDRKIAQDIMEAQARQIGELERRLESVVPAV